MFQLIATVIGRLTRGSTTAFVLLRAEVRANSVISRSIMFDKLPKILVMVT